MFTLRPMREVQPCNIHATSYELLDSLFAVGGWTDRTHNFGASHRFSSRTGRQGRSEKPPRSMFFSYASHRSSIRTRRATNPTARWTGSPSTGVGHSLLLPPDGYRATMQGSLPNWWLGYILNRHSAGIPAHQWLPAHGGSEFPPYPARYALEHPPPGRVLSAQYARATLR